MVKSFLVFSVVFIFFTSLICSAQEVIEISDPRLELRDNVIHIWYDILNSDPSDKYFIEIHVKDENGNEINAQTLNGDVGLVEGGGSNKHISWDPGADNVFINTRIYIKVHVRILFPEEPKEPHIDDVAVVEQSVPREFNRKAIIAQSLALPGLGLSRMTRKPHWIRGVAGYGCIAGSIILNKQALSTYAEIDELIVYEEKNELYEKSVNQYNNSRVLAYAAAGIWMTDFIWTLVGSRNLKRNPVYGEALSLSYDPLINAPILSFRFCF